MDDAPCHDATSHLSDDTANIRAQQEYVHHAASASRYALPSEHHLAWESKQGQGFRSLIHHVDGD
jgi:hypothetical protein